MTHHLSYQWFEHTADIGLEIYGATFEELLQNAVRGLADTIADVSKVHEKSVVKIELESSSREDLLIKLLQEVLYLFEIEHFIPASIVVENLDENGLKGFLRGEKFDEKRHLFKRVVKAVTHHQLMVKEVDGGWEGRVILDV